MRERTEAPPAVEVRPARPGDVRAFLPFWRSVLAEERFMRNDDLRTTAAQYRRRFRRSWTDDEAHVVAVEDRRLVGYVVTSRERHPVTRHVATLGIAVAADWRGRGIGTALLSTALAWGAAMGVEKILLSVYPHNERAIALYRRSGFVEEGRLSRQSRKSYGYEGEILMAAWIGAPDGLAGGGRG
jgi:ribosomal protein S18 acetylase RimI-like enzyme